MVQPVTSGKADISEQFGDFFIVSGGADYLDVDIANTHRLTLLNGDIQYPDRIGSLHIEGDVGPVIPQGLQRILHFSLGGTP